MPAMTILFRSMGRLFVRRTVAVAMTGALLLNCAWSGGALGNGATKTDAGVDSPTIQYQEAMAHASDPNTFTPGDAVVIPYTPRAGDKTVIDGSTPVALPAGSATGRAMAASTRGSVWAVGETDPPRNGSDKQVAPAPSITPSATGNAVPATTGNVLRREVYGFLPYWRLGDYINYDVVSTVAYFGTDLYTNGDLDKGTSGWAGWTSSSMTTVINAAHAAHVRVALTIESFAWGSDGQAAQQQLLSDPAARLNAVNQIVAAIRDRGADGVNLDFEPIASGMSANYIAFVRLLRTQLDSIHAGYELTFCGTGRPSTYDLTNLLASGAADNTFIMGYDFRDGGSAYAASMDPLTSPRVYDLTDAVNSYKAQAPASKIILGLPYYGIAYSTPDTSLYAQNISGTTYGQAVMVPYYTAAEMAAANLKQYDSIEQSAWASYYGTFGGAPTWRELYYDDAQALAARYDRVNYWNLGGVGIWVLGYDSGHPELNQVLADKFLTDHNPPKAGIVNISASQSSESFTVTWKGQDDWNGVSNYDLQVSTDGGDWTNWLTGTTATSSSFDGANGHNYSFRVRATDGVGNVGQWDVSTTYTASPAFAINGYATVTAASVAERGLPGNQYGAVFTATAGQVFKIIGGPASANGYTWYQVDGPITELSPVTPTFPGCWIAVSDATNVYMTPTTAPNTTTISAGIGNFTIGTAGKPPSMTGVDAGKTFSPDNDGIKDTLSLSWNDSGGFADVTLSIYRTDGSVAGTIDLGALGAGAQTYTWGGTDGTSVLPDGRYLLQLKGKIDDSTSYYAPSPGPFDAAAWANFGAIIDTTPSGTYFPLAPVRIMDTRINLGLGGPFVSGQSRPLVVAGYHGVPVGAMAVTGNLTITSPTATGFVRLGSTTANNFSTINFGAGDTRANGVTMGLASDGSLSAVYVSSISGTVQVIFDLTGYFARDPGGSTFFPVTPTRIVDTRYGQGLPRALTANTVSTFQVSGLAGVPADATAVVGNATIAGQDGLGYITVAPTMGAGEPPSSTLNFPVGDIRANNVTVPLNNGTMQVTYRTSTGHSVHFIFDVTGYFVHGQSGATFVPLSPGRIVDSRYGQGLSAPVRPYSGTIFAVRGQASVPLTAVAVVGNLTVTAQTALGWLAVTPTTTVGTSNLNFPVNDNRANGFACMLGANGYLYVTYGANPGSTTHVVVDILGYYR